MVASPGITGIPWFSASDYDKARQAMADVPGLPESHAMWLHGAETAERDMREQGRHPIRVVIVLEQFVAWCAERDLTLDSAARREYVRHVLSQTLR